MLPAAFRLRKNSEIQQVFRQGQFAYSQFLCLKFRPNDQKISRIALSIGTKYSAQAVQRNRAKRILRSSISKNLSQLQPGYDLVFYFKPVAPEKIDTETIEKLLNDVLKRARLI